MFGWRRGSKWSQLLRSLRSGHRRALLIGVLVLTIIVALVLGFGPFVRAMAEHEAGRRGVDLSVARVKMGWGRIWLYDVAFSLRDVPAVRGRWAVVSVDLGWRRLVTGLGVHGGAVEVSGSPDDVSRQIRAWRQRSSSGTSSARGRPVNYRAEGIAVKWRGLTTPDTTGHLWGLSYERDQNTDRFSVDRLRGTLRNATVEARRLYLELHSERGLRRCHRLRVAEARANLNLNGWFIEEGHTDAAPGSPPHSPRGARHSRSGDPASAPSPSTTDVRRPGAKPSSALVRAWFQGVTGRLDRWVTPSGRMELKTLRILLQSHRETLNIGPTRLGLQRKGRALTIQLLPGPQPQDAAFGLSLTWPFDGRPIALKVQGGPVSLSALGVMEGDFGLRDVARARLSLTGTATLPQDAEALRFSASGRLVNLSIQQPRLAPRLLTGISLGWSGEGRVVLNDGRVELDGAEIQLGDVRWRVRGSVERGDDHFAVDVEGEIPLTTCDRMLDAIPDGVAPLLSGMRLAGSFSLKTAIQFDTRRPSEASVRWEMDNRCRITEVGADISPERFKRPFAYDVKGADGSPERIMTGPGTAAWVPLVNISRYMETALLVCEDGRFWRHRGFDREAIANSIRDNLRAERFVRGASTISMQLAKNLFLKREKTVSRKLQEVVLTLLLEQELTKDEIMELYLNVIEYGPGVYGIGDAAEHYFRTDPSELGLSQAFFLASILPNPRASHFRADGQLSEGWSRYLHRLISIAHKRGRISDEELQSALSEHLVLGRSTPSGSSDGDSADRPAIDPLEQRP